MGDDRPYFETWNGQSILELPVHWSLDDWPMFGYGIDNGGNFTHPRTLFDNWLAEYRSARRDGRHTTFTMQPEVIGRVHGRWVMAMFGLRVWMKWPKASARNLPRQPVGR